jgi:hypothetical protein
MSTDIIYTNPTIIFNGKKLDFVFVNKGIKYLKNKYGKFTAAIHKIDGEDGEIDLDVVGEIIYAGLMCNKDAPSIEQVTEWLDDQPIAKTIEIAKTKISEAMTATFPEPDPN